MKEKLQKYIDNVLETTDDYNCMGFTYANIVYDAFYYSDRLENNIMDYELRQELSEYIENYFEEYYLPESSGILREKLEMISIKIIVEIIDISELQQLVEEILE